MIECRISVTIQAPSNIMDSVPAAWLCYHAAIRACSNACTVEAGAKPMYYPSQTCWHL